MSSIIELCSQASCFLGRELSAFEQLRGALVAQAEALSTFDLGALETRQVTLESAISDAENAVYRRVKWQQTHFSDLPEPTWKQLFDALPSEFGETHHVQLRDLRACSGEVKRSLLENQTYAHAAREMLAALRSVEQRVLQEKTDLYTSKGTLSGQVAISAVSGGTR